MDGDVGQSALVRHSSPVCCLPPFVPRDVLMMVLWSGQFEGEGLYPVRGYCVRPRSVVQDVSARVRRHCSQVHVA